MPENVYGARMVAPPGNEVIYNYGGTGALNKIFKFGCPDDQIQHCHWTELATRLSHRRYLSVAMIMPDNLVSGLCN